MAENVADIVVHLLRQIDRRNRVVGDHAVAPAALRDSLPVAVLEPAHDVVGVAIVDDKSHARRIGLAAEKKKEKKEEEKKRRKNEWKHHATSPQKREGGRGGGIGLIDCFSPS